jgi:hypothetical protein
VQPAWNVLWEAQLGSANFASPTVADDLVWVGTNNARPGARHGPARKPPPRRPAAKGPGVVIGRTRPRTSAAPPWGSGGGAWRRPSR